MDEWERRLANVLGLDQAVSDPSSLSAPDKRSLIFVVKNRSSGEVLLTIPTYGGSGSGAATTVLAAAQKSFSGPLRRVISPGGFAMIARSDFVGNKQIQNLVKSGVLVVVPAE